MEYQIEQGITPPQDVDSPQETVERKAKVEVKATFENQTATGVVLNNWLHAKQKQAEIKKQVDESQALVLQHIGEQISVGTNRFATGFFVLKATKSEKYEVNGADVNALNNALSQLAQSAGFEVARDIIQWKPSLNKKLYDKLSDEQKAILNPFLALSYSSPTLTIEEK